VDLLHEHKTTDYRGQNGWTTEAWNKIVKEFHQREQYVYFTKAQIQDKERELKRDYRLLKDAKNQSGAHFDEKTWRITADPALWKNILTSHPKAKKFRNKSFPLYEALGSFMMVSLVTMSLLSNMLCCLPFFSKTLLCKANS
jgi:3-methyladenine DNA glycosylase/8-oxoguanine DNA glycosylase